MFQAVQAVWANYCEEKNLIQYFGNTIRVHTHISEGKLNGKKREAEVATETLEQWYCWLNWNDVATRHRGAGERWCIDPRSSYTWLNCSYERVYYTAQSRIQYSTEQNPSFRRSSLFPSRQSSQLITESQIAITTTAHGEVTVRGGGRMNRPRSNISCLKQLSYGLRLNTTDRGVSHSLSSLRADSCWLFY